MPEPRTRRCCGRTCTRCSWCFACSPAETRGPKRPCCSACSTSTAEATSTPTSCASSCTPPAAPCTAWGRSRAGRASGACASSRPRSSRRPTPTATAGLTGRSSLCGRRPRAPPRAWSRAWPRWPPRRSAAARGATARSRWPARPRRLARSPPRRGRGTRAAPRRQRGASRRRRGASAAGPSRSPAGWSLTWRPWAARRRRQSLPEPPAHFV
mmetsp:Transcript_20243/g.77711  ORF Transcript_20243/g.77711 Transcript_20243/m.77711 type:complete len:212 (+) Transcript_20243:383-1018(+)